MGHTMHATYSPDDNKLRFTPDGRLSEEDYARAKAAGFRWAPRQKLFVAPRWTPAAEDLMLEWCGEIEDEDTTLVERAEGRADRFEDYSYKRAAESQRAHDAVSAIADNIPMGQPILVGHHSEKRARRDAEKIENGMRRAIRLWDTSEYWTARAASAIRHAKYLESPGVRARRIKTLEADRRRIVRTYTPNGSDVMMDRPPVCYREHEYGCDKCATVPHVYVGASRGGHWTPVDGLEAIEKGQARWLAHLDLRIGYERAMLGEQGATHLLEKKKRPKQPPLLNYRGVDDVIRVRNHYSREVDAMSQHEMTKAEYARINKDYKGTRFSEDGSHLVRSAMIRENGSHSLSLVYLTDSKDHGAPS